MIERSIGGYRLERELGRGGQGSAWLAEDTRLKRRVVVKVLSSTALLSSRAIERFRREAEIASKLDHPGICTVYEAGIDDGVPFMAMRYVEGISLAKILESGSTFEFKSIRNPGSPSQKSDPSVLIDFESSQGLSETLRVASPDTATDSVKGRSTSSVAPGRVAVQKLLQIIEKTADALDYAHRMNVLHRDIKPANIMVTPDFSPVILDFGLARQTEDDHELTMTGEIFGTPAYMAPEQVTGRRETIDATSDVWALGVTLYECLTGRRPFEAPTREGL